MTSIGKRIPLKLSMSIVNSVGVTVYPTWQPRHQRDKTSERANRGFEVRALLVRLGANGHVRCAVTKLYRSFEQKTLLSGNKLND